jgi:predicted DNA binding CopG/RHH family protein
MTTTVKRIAELATVTPGFSPRPEERRQSGKYLLLGGRNLKDGKLITTDADSYVGEIDRESFRRAIAKPGDVIVSTLFDRRKLYLYDKDDPPAVVNNSCAIIRAGQQSDYIITYLRSEQGGNDFLEKAGKATGGRFIPRVSTRDLGEIEIPILPIEKLARLGDARIEKASTRQLLDLQQELESKDAEIEHLRASQEIVVRFYEDRLQAVKEQLATDSLINRIKHGETATLEFKSSLRYNIRANKMDRDIENSTLKTIVAFCNTKGGELLIGVGDDKSVLGIEHDGFPNEDKFQLHLRNLLMDRIVPSVAEFVEFSMVMLDERAVCHVTCKQSKRQEIWLKPDKNAPELFYVRMGPSSTELQPRQALAYIKEHFEQE